MTLLACWERPDTIPSIESITSFNPSYLSTLSINSLTGLRPFFSFPLKQSVTDHKDAPSFGIRFAILCCSATGNPYPLVAVITVDLGPSVVNVQLFKIFSWPYLFLANSTISSRFDASVSISIL